MFSLLNVMWKLVVDVQDVSLWQFLLYSTLNKRSFLKRDRERRQDCNSNSFHTNILVKIWLIALVIVQCAHNCNNIIIIVIICFVRKDYHWHSLSSLVCNLSDHLTACVNFPVGQQCLCFQISAVGSVVKMQWIVAVNKNDALNHEDKTWIIII